jgi:hypothetical protein
MYSCMWGADPAEVEPIVIIFFTPNDLAYTIGEGVTVWRGLKNRMFP